MAKKQISVIERRLQGPSVFQAGSQPVPLVDDSYVVRWTNSEIHTDHAWQRINIQGWAYAEPQDIACPLDEIGAQARDGRVVRGERGKEVLVKMKASDFKKLKAHKQRENIKVTFDKAKVKSAMVAGVASEHGDEAASFIHKSKLDVVDHRERVAVDGD